MRKSVMPTAVILGGGLGTRLRSVVPGIAKVVAPVNGRPFIFYLLDQLNEFGVKRVILCTGYLADTVESLVGDRYRDIKVKYSRESVPVGTGGALKLAEKELQDNVILVMNGDSYIEFDLVGFMDSHSRNDASISILVAMVENAEYYGRVSVNEAGKITSFGKKGKLKSATTINTGIYLFCRDVISGITVDTPYSLETELFPLFVGRGLYGFTTNRQFIDIGHPEAYIKANKLMARVRT